MQTIYIAGQWVYIFLMVDLCKLSFKLIWWKYFHRIYIRSWPWVFDKLHNLHQYYPLAPEKLEISNDMLSQYCSSIANKYGIKIGGVKKLIPNLGIKSKYVVHYRNLKLHLSLGMKLAKGHRVLKFKQSNWLKNTLILIQTNKKILLIVLKKIFLNWWSIVFMVKQWKI